MFDPKGNKRSMDSLLLDPLTAPIWDQHLKMNWDDFPRDSKIESQRRMQWILLHIQKYRKIEKSHMLTLFVITVPCKLNNLKFK